MTNKQQAVAMSTEGKTLQEIAASLSVSERTVRRYLKESSSTQNTSDEPVLS